MIQYFVQQIKASVRLNDTTILIHALWGACQVIKWVRSRSRASGECGMLAPDGVDEHLRAVPDTLGRSEWSAKRSRSEREADHERRSVDLYKSGMCHFP